MGLEVTDATVARSTTGTGPGPERAAQISRENQAGVSAVRTASLEPVYIPNVGFAGMVVPPVVTSSPESDQISDCRKDKCIVDGMRYANSTDIPGNHPKPLLHPDGTQVLGPDKQPVFGPNGVDIEKIASNARAHHNWFSMPAALLKFRHSGEWDFQRRNTDDIPGIGVRPIWTKPYQNFANIAAGYILGSLGASLHEVAFYADKYCKIRHCNYNEARAEEYPNIGERHLRDYEIGIRLWNEYHPRERRPQTQMDRG
jgi:hypothetical protein